MEEKQRVAAAPAGERGERHNGPPRLARRLRKRGWSCQARAAENATAAAPHAPPVRGLKLYPLQASPKLLLVWRRTACPAGQGIETHMHGRVSGHFSQHCRTACPAGQGIETPDSAIGSGEQASMAPHRMPRRSGD